jgi:dethiobiotin synthetase
MRLVELIEQGQILLTGTDTDVGKSYVAVQLLNYAAARGKTVMGIKPIASGSRMLDAREQDIHECTLLNDDVQRLRNASSGRKQGIGHYAHTMHCFEPAIAPHIAAHRIGLTSSIDQLKLWWQRIPRAYDFAVIEGAGGFFSPLLPIASPPTIDKWSANLEHSDLAKICQAKVVLVVGLRLGCINSARMSAALIRNGCEYAGWIANELSPNFEAQAENLATLRAYLGEPIALCKFNSGFDQD